MVYAQQGYSGSGRLLSLHIRSGQHLEAYTCNVAMARAVHGDRAMSYTELSVAHSQGYDQPYMDDWGNEKG